MREEFGLQTILLAILCRSPRHVFTANAALAPIQDAMVAVSTSGASSFSCRFLPRLSLAEREQPRPAPPLFPAGCRANIWKLTTVLAGAAVFQAGSAVAAPLQDPNPSGTADTGLSACACIDRSSLLGRGVGCQCCFRPARRASGFEVPGRAEPSRLLPRPSDKPADLRL